SVATHVPMFSASLRAGTMIDTSGLASDGGGGCLSRRGRKRRSRGTTRANAIHGSAAATSAGPGTFNPPRRTRPPPSCALAASAGARHLCAPEPARSGPAQPAQKRRRGLDPLARRVPDPGALDLPELLLAGRAVASRHGENRHLSRAVAQLRRLRVVRAVAGRDRGRSESTRLNSSHVKISYAVFCLKKKKKRQQ